MQKAKILVIAPYEGMAEIFENISKNRDDIELTTQTGDLDSGRKIAENLAHKNYDVIISRGGTAELIRSSVEIPVVDISISGYDILRSIKMAESYSGKFIIAGFSGITKHARVLCDLLQYDIDIITFTSEEGALAALRTAKNDGASLVICDMTGANYAKILNMNSILITSGTESINDAINEAKKLVHSSHHVHKQKNLFQSLLTDEDREFLIYDPAGSLWFSSFSIDGMNVSLMNVIQTYLKAFLKVPNQSVARQIRDKVYTFTCRHLYMDEQKYTAIIINQKPALFDEDDIGITIYNKPDTDSTNFSNFFGSSNKIGITAHIIEDYSKSSLPVLITGEEGTGKDKVASLIYENGPYRTSPFYVIDCKYISERKWNYILNNENSPLADVHSTIYIKNVCTLSHSQLEKLFNYMDHTDLAKRNRLILSLLITNELSQEALTIKSQLEKQLSCLTLNLLPLRERSDDIPSITALYLHKLNVSLGKQIIGLEAEAMDLFTAFSWPHNLDQLQHVLKELAVVTKTPYITCNDVKYFLEQETPPVHSLPSTDLDLTQTLEEINYQIIRNVLAEEHENKEKTASRLGISRSTLWRILKSHNGGVST